MADYTTQAINGYNASPPPDDGSTTDANEITWAKIKDKLADPIKNYVDAIQTEIDSVVDALDPPFNAGVTTKTAAFTSALADNGKLILCDASGGAFTVTLLAAATAGDGHTLVFQKSDSSGNAITIDGNAAETIDGQTTITLENNGDTVILTCDGSNWEIGAVSSGAWDTPRPGSNMLINGDFRRSVRGTTFDSTTTPANNDDTYLLDRWILLSDGNDIVDVTQQTNGTVGTYAYLQADVETIQKKFGFAQIVEQKNMVYNLGADKRVSLSFNARVSDATKLDNIKAVVLSWDGTADSVTSDVVSAWNAADTTPTWATNLTAENTPANLSVTATDTRFKIEGISIDTASVKNLVVFIWSDAVADNDTAGTLLQITDVQLEPGSKCTDFERDSLPVLNAKCDWYARAFDYDSAAGEAIESAELVSTSSARVVFGYPAMRSAPAFTLTAAGTFDIIHGTGGGVDNATSISASDIGKASALLSVGVSGTPFTVDGWARLVRDGSDTTKIVLDGEM